MTIYTREQITQNPKLIELLNLIKRSHQVSKGQEEELKQLPLGTVNNSRFFAAYSTTEQTELFVHYDCQTSRNSDDGALAVGIDCIAVYDNEQAWEMSRLMGMLMCKLHGLRSEDVYNPHEKYN